MKFGFLSTSRRLTDRVFNITFTLTAVGFLLNLHDWELVILRLVGITGLAWALSSDVMQRIYGTKEDHAVRFKWWVHLLGLIVVITTFCFLSVIFNEDIQYLYE